MTRPLPLRAEQPPDDTTVVVRAGVMSADSLRRAAQRSFDLYAVFGVSVEGVIGTSVQDACRNDRVIAYRRVRLSTLTHPSEGFALLAAFDHPHFTLVLPDLSQLTLARLDRSFDGPIPNPARPAD